MNLLSRCTAAATICLAMLGATSIAHAFSQDFFLKGGGLDSCDAIKTKLLNATQGLTIGIVDTSVRLLSRQPDSLIRRKCGESIAKQASDLAAAFVKAGDPRGEDYANRLASLDFWLRADGNRRNPGTSADMITAAIFVCLLDARLDLSE